MPFSHSCIRCFADTRPGGVRHPDQGSRLPFVHHRMDGWRQHAFEFLDVQGVQPFGGRISRAHAHAVSFSGPTHGHPGPPVLRVRRPALSQARYRLQDVALRRPGWAVASRERGHRCARRPASRSAAARAPGTAARHDVRIRAPLRCSLSSPYASTPSSSRMAPEGRPVWHRAEPQRATVTRLSSRRTRRAGRHSRALQQAGMAAPGGRAGSAPRRGFR